MTRFVIQPTTKEGLARHVEDEHPEHVYPHGAQLRAWRKDEIDSEHADMHRNCAAGHTPGHTHTRQEVTA